MKGFKLPFLFENRKLNQLFSCFFLVFLLKFLWFDLAWCMMFTFRPFSFIETYLSALGATMIGLVCLVCFRAVKLTLVLSLLLDILLIANLMYARTYYTAIPLDSYLIADNLKDYTDSVYNSLRWVDVFFPISTFFLFVVWWRMFRRITKIPQLQSYSSIYTYIFLVLTVLSLNWGLVAGKGVHGNLCSGFNYLKNPPEIEMIQPFNGLYISS